jgi:hypothetical protein
MMQKAVLYVKEILSQPVELGRDLIPVASSRLWTSANPDYCLKELISAKIIRRLTSVNYHEFTCGQKVVRCVSMA